MVRLVYLAEVNSHTFLHLSTAAEGFCLRDYSNPLDTAPREVMRQNGDWTTSKVLGTVEKPGNCLRKVPVKPRQDFPYWHTQIAAANSEIITNPKPAPTPQRFWPREVIIGVLIAVLGAAIVAWLGLNK